MPPKKINGKPTLSTMKQLADKDRKIAELKAALAKKETDMKKREAKTNGIIDRICDSIEKAVVFISVLAHAQRKVNGELVELAEHLSICCGGSMSRSSIVANMQATGRTILELARNDVVSPINDVLEELCKVANLDSHHIVQQVIPEVEDDATSVQDVIDAIAKRVTIIVSQSKLVWDAEDLTEAEKAGRIAKLADDVAAQLKIDPTFDFETNIVPRVDDDLKEEPLATDVSVADLMRRKLSLHE